MFGACLCSWQEHASGRHAMHPALTCLQAPGHEYEAKQLPFVEMSGLAKERRTSFPSARALHSVKFTRCTLMRVPPTLCICHPIYNHQSGLPQPHQTLYGF